MYYIINQNILVILLLPVLIFAFPQPEPEPGRATDGIDFNQVLNISQQQSDVGDEDINTRGLVVVDVFCTYNIFFYIM